MLNPNSKYALEDPRAQIQLWLDNGVLSSPVTFNGEILTAKGDLPDGFAANGWAVNTPSDIGGLVSRGVEALRARLQAIGRTDLAGVLPERHVGRFPQPPEEMFGWAVVDPTRFDLNTAGTPFKFTPDQQDQLLDNIVGYDNNLMGRVGMANWTPQFANMYRGEPEVGGRSLPTASSPSDPRPSSGWVGLYHREYAKDQSYVQVLTRWRRRQIHRLDNHFIYDLWFDMRTDAAVTRYWTAWARTFGVEV